MTSPITRVGPRPLRSDERPPGAGRARLPSPPGGVEATQHRAGCPRRTRAYGTERRLPLLTFTVTRSIMSTAKNIVAESAAAEQPQSPTYDEANKAVRALRRTTSTMCRHSPPCPSDSATDRQAARASVARHEQGWALLCNDVLLFEDTGQLLPDGQVVAPCRSDASGRAA